MRLSLYIIVILSLFNTSCKKFINEQSQDQLIPTTATDFLQLLNGSAYPKMTNDLNSPLQRELMFMDDDVRFVNYKVIFPPSPTDYTEQQGYLPMYTWQPDMYEQVVTLGASKSANNPWANYYSLIMGANIALDNADKCTGSVNDKNYLKGQAYGLRAYYYLMLVNLYGKPYNAAGVSPDQSPGVPIVLTAVYDVASAMKPRNTVKEVYDRVVSDLDSSILYLEKNKTVNIYRFNYIAAHLLASRVYMYMGKWDKSVKEASLALAAQPGLMQLSGWPGTTGTATPSPITNPVIGSGNIETIWTYSSFADYNVLIGTGKKMVTYSDSLIYSYETGDLRKGVFLIPLSATEATRYAYAYANGKQYNPKADATGKSFRVAELYLNRAEAQSQLYKQNGDNAAAQSAINDLNMLRQNRFAAGTYVPLTLTNVTADSLITVCRKERRRELFGEDQRWFDLRRYGMPAISHVAFDDAGNKMTYVLKQNDPQYTWAIPLDVMQQNNKLVQNEKAPARMPQ